MEKGIRLNCITADYFSCHLCKVTVKRPVECSVCEQLFCYDCLKTFMQNGKKICPVGCTDAKFEKVGHAFEKLMGFIYGNCKYEECQHIESIKTLWAHEKSCRYGRKKLEVDIDESVKQRDAFWMDVLQKVITPSSHSLRVQSFVENNHISFANGCQQGIWYSGDMKALAGCMKLKRSICSKFSTEEGTQMVGVKKLRHINDIGLWMREKKENLMRIC